MVLHFVQYTPAKIFHGVAPFKFHEFPHSYSPSPSSALGGRLSIGVSKLDLGLVLFSQAGKGPRRVLCRPGLFAAQLCSIVGNPCTTSQYEAIDGIQLSSRVHPSQILLVQGTEDLAKCTMARALALGGPRGKARPSQGRLPDLQDEIHLFLSPCRIEMHFLSLHHLTSPPGGIASSHVWAMSHSCSQCTACPIMRSQPHQILGEPQRCLAGGRAHIW